MLTESRHPSFDGSAAVLPVCAVIVSYNRCLDLRRCLSSLGRQIPKLSRLIVVDNGSQDGTIDMVQSEFPWVELYAASDNLGPCIARNAAVEMSDEPLVWFLDSDTEIPAEDGAQKLVALFDGDDIIGAGGEAVLGPNGEIVGVKRLRLTRNAMVQGDIILQDMPVSACEVIASCNLMMRRATFDRLGGFDPFYFFFYEDMDLTWRASRLGTLLALSPMPVIHRYSESIRIRSLWPESRNRMYFILKNLPLWQVPLLPLFDVMTVLRLDSLKRLLRRSRQGDSAISLVTITEASPAAAPKRALRRAVIMVLRLVAKLAMAYAVFPMVIGPALAARRRRQGARDPAVGLIRRLTAVPQQVA